MPGPTVKLRPPGRGFGPSPRSGPLSAPQRSLYDCNGSGMTNYQIHGPARVCAATGRELRPGEKVFSVLRDESGQFVRTDYAADVWPGPPAGVVAWWAGRVPEGGKPARPVINDDLLADCLDRKSVV